MSAKQFIPRGYQKLAIEKMVSEKGFFVILDMGLGKTVSTLTAISEIMHNRFDIAKVLIIAPLKVADNVWTSEVSEWQHTSYLKVSKVLGTAKERLKALEEKADIYTINVENLAWLIKIYGGHWPFDMIVLDESSLFKNHQAKRFKILKKIKKDKIVLLTGTPRPKSLIDLWSQVYLIDQGKRLGRTISEYRQKYFMPGAGSGHVVYEWIPQKGAEEEIYKKIADISMSVKATDYPERIDNVIKVKLPVEAKEKYKQLERDLLLPLADSDIVANTAAALSNKLLQMANGCVYDENSEMQEIHSTKLDYLEEIIETSCGQSLLVFYWFRHDLERLKSKFPNARELKSGQDIKDWNDGKILLLLAHPASSGHGINLQFGGHIIVWFSLTWSLEYYQQANARLHRQGQKEGVIIHHLVAEGTVDEQVMRALKEKDVGQNRMMEAVRVRMESLKGESET